MRIFTRKPFLTPPMARSGDRAPHPLLSMDHPVGRGPQTRPFPREPGTPERRETGAHRACFPTNRTSCRGGPVCPPFFRDLGTSEKRSGTEPAPYKVFYR